MKAIKIVTGLVVAAIAIIAIVVVIGLQNINGIVKAAIETVGTQVTGTEVRLAEVDITLTEGRGVLLGLSIANPKGFSDNSAFSLGQIALQIDPISITGDVIVIEELTISAAKLLAEQKNIKDTNLQALLDNVAAGAKSGEANNGGASSATNDSSDPAQQVKLAVKHFRFDASELQLVTEQLGEKTLKLPAIELNNLGSAEQGLTPEQLSQAILKPLLAQAKAAAKKELERLAKREAEDQLKQKLSEELSDEQKGQIDQLKSLFKK
ncbi:MAG: hypothetical protein V7707_10765 [Motiliproteus sp.]